MEQVNNKMTVEIWSDIMCPFCYLGKRKFEAALEKFPEKENVSIVWKSFQLNPRLETDTTITIHQYLSDIKGIYPSRARALNETVSASAREFGLEYNFDKAVVANTFRAHILLHFAKRQGKQGEVEENLFRAYFTEGKNVDDPETLRELGRNAGLNVDNLASAMEDESFIDEVREDIYEASQLDIRGVPFFVFDRRYGISGAQEPELFLQTLNKAHSEWRKKNPGALPWVEQGESCSIDGECM